jgi:hypothetical protein
MKLAGRLMTRTGQELPCETIDISAGGLALKTAARPTRGEHIVIYLDLLGRVEGKTVRELPNGCAVEFKAPAGRDNLLHEKLSFLNRQKEPTGRIRLNDRIVPDHPATTITIGSTTIPVDVIDFSRSGASLRLPFAVTVGTSLKIGAERKARVIHVDEDAAGVEFSRLLPIEVFDTTFRF